MTAQALGPLLSALQERGEDRFDPVRFHYIQAMAQRALAQRESVSRIVENKAREALAAYQADLAQAQEKAKMMLDRAAQHCPDSAQTMQGLFDRCEFRALARMARMARRAEAAGNAAQLPALIEHMDRGHPASAQDQPQLSLDDILQQQEFDALQGAADSAAERRPAGELKAARHLRASLKKRSGDKLVAQTLSDIPQDSGPLNPQRLVIDSLETMRELSPQYLNRYVEYMDTLLRLQQSAGDS